MRSTRHTVVWVGLVCGLLLAPAGCGGDKVGGDGEAAAAKATASAGAASRAAPRGREKSLTPAENQAHCEALLGEAARQAIGLTEPWLHQVPDPLLGERKIVCSFQWPAARDQPPKGMVMATFDCGPRQINAAQLKEVWKDKIAEVDVGGPASRVDITVPQYWMFSETPRCAVMASAAFGAEDRVLPWARHIRTQVAAAAQRLGPQ